MTEHCCRTLFLKLALWGTKQSKLLLKNTPFANDARAVASGFYRVDANVSNEHPFRRKIFIFFAANTGLIQATIWSKKKCGLTENARKGSLCSVVEQLPSAP